VQGGQGLYNPEQQTNRTTDSWQRYTTKFVSTVHSFTKMDVNGRRNWMLRQIDINWEEVEQDEDLQK
jgi:hypothetical protein